MKKRVYRKSETVSVDKVLKSELKQINIAKIQPTLGREVSLKEIIDTLIRIFLEDPEMQERVMSMLTIEE